MKDIMRTTLYAELGEVDRISCAAEPSTEIVESGGLMFPIPAADALDEFVPINCPRRGTVNTTEQLGCMSCGNASIDTSYPGLSSVEIQL